MPLLSFTQLNFAEEAYLAAIPPEGATIKQLAELVRRSHSATSRMVDNLRRHGLVTVSIDEDDPAADQRLRIVRRIDR